MFSFSLTDIAKKFSKFLIVTKQAVLTLMKTKGSTRSQCHTNVYKIELKVRKYGISRREKLNGRFV